MLRAVSSLLVVLLESLGGLCFLPKMLLADEGIPVESEFVRNACGSCHPTDERNLVSRVSYLRKTPEGWQQTLKRMIRLGQPENGMARLGGVQFPKRFVQFEAVALHRGPDGKRFTDDDIDLGPVKADWSLEESGAGDAILVYDTSTLNLMQSVFAGGDVMLPARALPRSVLTGTDQF